LRGELIWDFDGTLAFRHSADRAWSHLLIETLDLREPGHGVTLDAVRPAMQSGFPWHSSEPHPQLSTSTAWWQLVEGLLARAYEMVGFTTSRALELAADAHYLYVDHRVGWQLFEDVVPELGRLNDQGWRHVILSNHVPELRQLVDGLELRPFFDRVICSAETGFEKPHPGAFAAAVEGYEGDGPVWMIGDSYTADIAGAEAAGLNAILVRRPHTDSTHYAPSLSHIAKILG
jgi:putative hydrolase of the HAD superfamily